MKRRDFLALVSTAGMAAAVGGLSSGCRSPVGPGGHLRATPHRQGVGQPVRVELDLPALRNRSASADAEPVLAPELVVIRDGVVGWSADVDAKEVSAGRGRWLWEWVPPAVRPTALEMQREVVSYRLLAFDQRGRPMGLASEPVEVVCAWRGWGS